MSDTTFNILITIISSLTFVLDFGIFLGFKKYIKIYIGYFCISLITTPIVIHYRDFGMIVLGLVSFIYFTYANMRIVSIALCFFSTMFAFLIGDALSGFILIKILNFTYEYITNNNNILFCSNTIVFCFSLLFSFLIKKLISKNTFSLRKVFFNNTTKKIFLFTFLVFVIILSSFRIILIIYVSYTSENFITLYICVVIILLVIIYLLYCITSRTITISIKKEFTDKENKQLKEYSSMLEDMSSDLRKFKHDYINILYSLGDYINKGDIEGLRKYYHEDLLPESRGIVKNDKNITLLKNVKITPLKALISSKLLAAQADGIEINAEVLEEIDKLSIKTIDICRIIGIFLDNAAEAVILCEKKFINVAMIKIEDNVIIVIVNSCSKDVPPVYELYKKNYSTKGENRGIGLTSVKELIDKSYKNILLNTSVNDGIFKQELIIKNCNLD